MFKYIKRLKEEIQRLEEKKDMISNQDTNECGEIEVFEQWIKSQKKHYRKTMLLFGAMGLSLLSIVVAMIGFFIDSASTKVFGNCMTVLVGITIVFCAPKPINKMGFSVIALAIFSIGCIVLPALN